MDATRKLGDYMRESRALAEAWKSGSAPKPRRLGVLSSFSSEFLRPYLVVMSHQLAPLDPWFAPFGQFEQVITDPTSPMHVEPPEVIWIALRLEDLDARLVHVHAGLTTELIHQRLEALTKRVVALAELTRSRFNAPILVSNFALPYGLSAGLFDASDPDGLIFHLMDANRALARGLRSIPDAHVFDYLGTTADCGARTFRDAKLFHMAKVPCAPTNQARLAERVVRAAAAVLTPRAKCIVLDLDNTLWGGVLGDDGMEGLALGDDYPGSVYKELQVALLGLRDRGFLLAVASKNDESAVLEILEKHPEQILRREHFSHIAANWEPKPHNLRRIAEALNIGLDALVFFDDNPVERAQVRSELPMVQVIEVPSDSLGYLGALQSIASLDQPRLVEEDRDRARMYQQEALRRVHTQGKPSGDFLKDLRMVATVGLADKSTLNRIHQLVTKTNQFNLTTRRHELALMRQWMESDTARVAWLRLTDSYGDLGLVCVGILRAVRAEVWEIDTLLMSCRVMGREVERAFLAYLIELARACGAREIIGNFRATAKNHIVREFYPKYGFAEIGPDTEDAGIVFRLSGDGPTWPDFIERLDHPDAQSRGDP